MFPLLEYGLGLVVQPPIEIHKIISTILSNLLEGGRLGTILINYIPNYIDGFNVIYIVVEEFSVLI